MAVVGTVKWVLLDVFEGQQETSVCLSRFQFAFLFAAGSVRSSLVKIFTFLFPNGIPT
jgi:hypothetical protein